MAITLHTDEEIGEVPEQTELVEGRFRDDFQKAVDGDVEKLKMETATAGWPAHDPKKLWKRYVVGADDVAGIKAVIRRAATLHKVEADFYKNATTEAGHVAVKFHVSRKPVMEKGEPKMENGKPVFVKDDTLDAHGKPVKKAA